MKNSNNVEAFFALLRAGLWEDETYLFQLHSIDYKEVFKIAEYQSVIGLIAAGLEYVKGNNTQKEDVLLFVSSALQLEQRNKAMNAFIDELVLNMRSAGIYTLLLKGQGIAQCYAKPLWRASGDVDLFLSEDNYNKAKSFLTPMASSIDTEETYKKHLGLTIDGWVVELHGNLYSSLSKRIEKGLDEIYNDTFYRGNVRSWINEGKSIFQLGYENDIVYVFTHILQHYFHGGIGLRQVCDWSRLLWTANGKYDVKKLNEKLREMRILSEWKAFAYFAVKELGTPEEVIPFYEAKKKWADKANRIKSFIMSSGNFGHRDLTYVKKLTYLNRKLHSFRSVVNELFRHFRTFPVDSIRFFVYYMGIRMKAVARGE